MSIWLESQDTWIALSLPMYIERKTCVYTGGSFSFLLGIKVIYASSGGWGEHDIMEHV